MGFLYKWGFSSYIFYLVQNALRTDFLWVIVQFYAFARTQVFNKSDLWSPWSIFPYTTDLNILYGLWSFVFLIFWLVFSLLGGVGCRLIISARVEFSTQSNFIALQCSWRPERTFLPILTNFIDRLRILSVGQIMDVIHILQAPLLICPESDAGLLWITFSSLPIEVSWSVQGPIPRRTQMLSLVSSTHSSGSVKSFGRDLVSTQPGISFLLIMYEVREHLMFRAEAELSLIKPSDWFYKEKQYYSSLPHGKAIWF